MMLELQLRAVGVGLVALALFHATFPRRFHWKEELARLSLINHDLMRVHTLFIALMLAFFGVLSFLLAGHLDDGALAVALLAGLAVFWGVRLVVQFALFDARLWRGNGPRTLVHVLMALLWTYLTALFAVAAWTATR